MKVLRTRFIGIIAAAMLLGGCAKAPEAEDTLVVLTAPTVAPVVTPLPTPEATPTPAPTKRPEPTPAPEKEDKQEEQKPKDTPKPTSKPEKEPDGFKDTPHKDSYTPVELKAQSRKVKDFSAKAHDGSTVTQEYFAQGKLTLVNFWSTT